MPDKISDNEIIKALEELCDNAFKKLENPIKRKEKIKIWDILCKSLDLINRQKAEIEKLWLCIKRLKREVGMHERYYDPDDEVDDIIKGVMGQDMCDIKAEIKAEAYKECIEKVKEEIAEALKSNYKAVQGRIAYYENEGDMFVGDEFVDYCNGKIDCLRGLDDFCDNLLKELVGDTDERNSKV